MPIRISGATGSNAASANGTYDPTEEISSGGCYVYEKRGDSGKLLELLAGRWEVKETKDKGKNVGWISIACEGPKAPEKCRGTWGVWNGSGWIEQESVRVEAVPLVRD